MDAFKDYFFLGKITKLHGYDGKVVLFLDVDDPEEYQNLEVVFIDQNHQPVPYFIEESFLKGDKLIVRFQDTDSSDNAAALVNKNLYLPLSQLPKLAGNQFYYHEVPGFKVVDAKHGELGTVETVLEYPNQAVLQVMQGEKEILIPINDEVIRSVDRKAKTIKVQTPEGLVELYLNES
ncbi:MAG: 16S rRNA processing protein RimM [Bacteroidales bacterium]|nr:16S rRNA processing protein RimM [Bacteroidales bacterium]